jgi:hypothetical protein
MLHACLYTICFVFCYTLWHFYAFFETNLLTRCHSASSLFSAVMPRVSLIVILVMYVRYLYSINCPTVVCLPNMLYLSYGETPLVNCGPWSSFLYIALPFYFTRSVYFLTLLLFFYHSIRSILCLQQIGEIDNLIVSWEQSSCLCCV